MSRSPLMPTERRRIRKIIIIAFSVNDMLSTIVFMILCMLLGSPLLYCAPPDNLTTGGSLNDSNNDTLISAGQRFQLGFFAPTGNSSCRRYIGIWYLSNPRTVVWVANRDNPLTVRTGIFTLTEDGNLKIINGNDNHHFFTNLTGSSHRTLKLLDSGNLVLSDDQLGTTSWQSFENPTDTFLPGMKMNENLKLTSGISDEDPGSGNFTFKQDDENENRYIINLKNTRVYWISGDTGNFMTSRKIPPVVAFFLSNFSNPVNRTLHKSSDKRNYSNSRMLMNYSGEIQLFRWEDKTGWSLIWSEPGDRCSVNNACGDFGSCNINNKTMMCKCLPGFEPSSPDDWNSRDFSSGCIRSRNSIITCKKNDTFQNLGMMKVGKPDIPIDGVESEKNCTKNCLDKCNCLAYSYKEDNRTRRGDTAGERWCWIWTASLKNLQEDFVDGHNLSIRVMVSGPKQVEEGSTNKKISLSLKGAIIFTMVIIVVLLSCIITFISYKRRLTNEQEGRESRESIRAYPMLHLYDSERQVRDLIESGQFKEEDKEGIDVPFFDLESILVATDNFSDANKLGQGGFGPVYKGQFFGGQEIAIKRLSSHSVQGLEEFKNEVVLIAKLQHRNLVRLLGYCIKGDEKILLYEYMPNKSLDAFIFDRTLCMLLNWEKRFDIILGIARGLLYLHQDSRLKIVHRDLKTSNILLDEEMNPRISDFGLARIVGGQETEVNTTRVVGTYGYMSPEYALDGLFSIKSDVFSFGVVVLEIISGKKNTRFNQSKQASNLLGYAWRLWKEEKALDLMDQTLYETCNTSEVLKCIIIGLLCVQEDVDDRPTMSNVVFMLGSEIATLPNPKQPAFIVRKYHAGTSSSSSSKPIKMNSINELTVTIEEGR